MDTEVPIGTIFPCYTGEVNHPGWIVCDAREYENLDGIFDLLLEMDIGKNGGDGKYISPDFRNMEFVDTSATDNNMFVRTFDKIIKNDGHVHSFSAGNEVSSSDYMDPGVSIFHHNAEFIHSFMELYRNQGLSGPSSGPSILWMMKYK